MFLVSQQVQINKAKKKTERHTNEVGGMMEGVQARTMNTSVRNSVQRERPKFSYLRFRFLSAVLPVTVAGTTMFYYKESCG